MPVFKSRQPNIDVPTDIAVWDWLFDSPSSAINRYDKCELAGYVDSESKSRIDWEQVKETSTFISTALHEKFNFRPGDTLTLFSGNTIWYPVVLFAGVRLGGIVSGASPAYNIEEMATVLKTGQSKFLVTNEASLNVAVSAAEQVGIPRDHIFLLNGQKEGFVSVQDLIEIGKTHGTVNQVPSFKLSEGQSNKDVCGLLCFSSGTTGLPKAVMVSHHNVIAQALQVAQITPASQKKTLAVLPFYHISGLVHILHLPVLINAEVIMLPKFSMGPMLDAITEYQIEELLVVPPLIIRLVHDDVVRNYDLSCVKRFSSGAAPVSEEIIQQLKKKFPGRGFKNGYGMTETTSCLSGFPPELYDFKYAHTVGRLLANTEIIIRKDDGTEAKVGERGEIFARGPQCVMGYLNNEKANAETFNIDGQWLRTGDLASVDEEGIITIHDRLKEIIKVKGVGVAPAELEDLLLGHEKIKDVAVIGKPDAYSGELPKAFVVLKDTGHTDEKTQNELIEYVKARKVREKWVRELEFVSEIPKSASGKILRKELKAKELAAAQG